MYGKHFRTKIQNRLTFAIEHVTIYEKGGKRIMAGRKSKYSSNENNTIKNKIWSVALYIRLSQEDEDNRKRKEGK